MAKTQPRHDPTKFPEGGAKVGDVALVVTHRGDKAGIRNRRTWQGHDITIRPATVSAVGFENEHGYFLDVQVLFNDTKREKILTPRSSLPVNMYLNKPGGEALLILCPADEQPEMLQTWARDNRAVVIRNPGCSPPQLGLLCGKCLGDLVRICTTKEHQDLRWWHGRFSVGKPMLVDGDEELACDHCQTTYKMPDEFDDYT